MRCEQKKSSSGTVPIQITNKRVFTCNFHDLICSRNVREFSILHQFFELTLNNPQLSNLNNGNPFLFPILLNCPTYIKKVRFNIGLNIYNIITLGTQIDPPRDSRLTPNTILITLSEWIFGAWGHHWKTAKSWQILRKFSLKFLIRQ